jgi:endogenous inhibitor of DNA gyrase (YacG/DUF329 family)
MNVKCPYCRKNTSIEENPFRPFCSERCRLLDLGNWISGAYHISSEEDPEENGSEFMQEKDLE